MEFRIFIVIPAYNEEAMVGRVIAEVSSNLSSFVPPSCNQGGGQEGDLIIPHIIVVDDGSQDDTYKIAKQNGATVLRHILNRGQGAALRTGINYALEQGADIIITYDADGQFEASEISRLCQPIIAGECDVTLGSRFKNIFTACSIPLTKKILLKSAILFTNLTSGLKLSDTHNGFRAFSRKAAQQIKITQDKMAHASEIISEIGRLGLKYKEVPITVKYTKYSRAKGQRITNAPRILFDLILK